jgi:hypothetical protein
MLWEFVHAANDVFKNQIQWPQGGVLLNVLEGFKEISGWLETQGAIDVVQTHIQKPKLQCFVVNDYSFKSKGYNMQLQAIVNPKKQFLDVFVGMPSSLNDAWVL